MRYKKNISKVDLVSAICWVIVFPGFFIYNTAVQRGLLLPYLGGYYTASILMVSIILTPYYLCLSENKSKNLSSGKSHLVRVSKIFWLYLLLFGFMISFGVVANLNEDITNPLAAYFFKFYGLYLVSLLCPWESTEFTKVVKFFQCIIYSSIIIGSSEGAYLENIVNPFVDDRMLDYHGLALSFAVISITAGYSTDKTLIRWFQWFMAVTGLFLIGARSEFVGIIFSILIIEFFKNKNLSDYLYLFFAGLISIILGYIVLGLNTDSHRMLGLVDVGSDQSAIERKILNAKALDTVSNNPIFGNFGSYDPGQYAHNIVSAWVDLGFIGFVLLVILMIVPITSIISIKANKRSDFINFVLAFLCMCFILLLFAKSYFYQMIPVVIGLYTRATMFNGLAFVLKDDIVHKKY